MEHRLSVRGANGKLVHEEKLTASLVLAPGSNTAEAVLDADGADAWQVPSFSLKVAATAPPSAVSVADAQVREGPGAVLSFNVTLDHASSATSKVKWATSDGTAVAGEDYTAGSGTLTFAAGETSKTVEVAVLDDAHDEGEETMTLTLSSPEGVQEGDMKATGTIANENPLLFAWLSRFGRTVASQTVDEVTERFAASPGAGSSVTLGGQRIGLSSLMDATGTPGAGGSAAGRGPALGPGQAPGSGEGEAEADAKELLTALAAAGSGSGSGAGEPDDGESDYSVIPGAPAAAESQSMTALDLLLGSAFHLSAGGRDNGHAPRWTAWGRASVQRFENTNGGLPVDGGVVTGVFGVDWERGKRLAGVALTHSVGEGGMRPRGLSMTFDIENTMTAVNPYVRAKLSDRLSASALAGYGTGDLTLSQRRRASDGNGEAAGTGRSRGRPTSR